MNKTASTHDGPASGVLRDGRRSMDRIFAPRTVTVIGATEKPDAVAATASSSRASSSIVPERRSIFP